jgi:hypothetical protein
MPRDSSNVMRTSSILVAFLLAAACSKSSPPPSEPSPPAPTTPATGERPALTSAACEAQGGQVIGDIGDGSVHRPEYRCASNGEAPFANIVNDPNQGPVAIEGAVCCKK